MSGPATVTGPVVVSGVLPEVSVERQLLAELKAAHRLLAVALGCMTPAGQAKFARQTELMGLAEDGATRHHERAAVIARAERRVARRDAWPFPPPELDAAEAA